MKTLALTCVVALTLSTSAFAQNGPRVRSVTPNPGAGNSIQEQPGGSLRLPGPSGGRVASRTPINFGTPGPFVSPGPRVSPGPIVTPAPPRRITQVVPPVAPPVVTPNIIPQTPPAVQVAPPAVVPGQPRVLQPPIQTIAPPTVAPTFRTLPCGTRVRVRTCRPRPIVKRICQPVCCNELITLPCDLGPECGTIVLVLEDRYAARIPVVNWAAGGATCRLPNLDFVDPISCKLVLLDCHGNLETYFNVTLSAAGH